MQKLSGDDHKQITEIIQSMVDAGMDMIICTGGMSVDPDDRTPLAIKNTGAEIVTYGAPVLPGAMFMLGYVKGEIPIVGLPGCVMYAKRTIFDLVTGAEIVTYGAPVLPGAMFMLGYVKGEIPIVGLPGCVMYAKRTIFDLVLPRLLAGEKIEKEELDRLGEGGLCLNCPICTFPNCGFGKGV